MIIKSYTDLEQSKKLAEILPIESADMCYIQDLLAGGKYGDYKPYIGNLIPAYGQDKIRCWSLTALLSILPEIQGSKPVIALDDNYIAYPHMSDLHTKADNLIDACVTLIIKLQEENKIT